MTPSHLIRMGAHALILLIGMHFCFAPFCTLAADGANTLDLSGKWALQLDRDDKGVDGKWFAAALPKPDASIPLPGSLSLSGIGDDVTVDTKWMGGIVDRSWFTAPEYEKYRQPGNVKVPFWLQPDKYYAGAAWYQRDIDVSVTWKALRVVLTLERPHWETRVWVDDRAFGSNNSLGTPHEYDLGLLTPGKHRLTIRVDNRMVVDVGRDSHSVSDHTQGNWNGIVGRMELRATPPVWIEDLQVFPHVATKSATVKGKIGNASGQAGRGAVKLSAQLFNVETTVAPVPVEKSVDVSWDEKGGAFEAEIALGATAQTWSEFTPALYRLTAALDSGKDSKDAKDNKETISVVFGLREVSVDGTQIAVNGRKIFIRGTLDCCIFPKTGHPPTDVASWKRIVSIAKAHGLNNIRFHSWCPPEAAFIAADELGFYYQVECSSWANSTTSLGDGKPVDQWLYDEADRMLKYYGNHPSFLLMPYGNEPGGKKHAAYLAKWVSNYKAKDSRRLYTSGAGWPEIPENQFHVVPAPRIQGWGQGLKSRINGRPPETQTDYSQYIKARNVPVISHEIGEWCVYPNFDEIPKYTGYLKPKNFEIFRESLKARGMLDQAHDFLMASGKLQTLCYKEDIESALRTAGMGGFQLLDLHDFPGQGTALVGVLDPFWDSKGYVTPEEYHRFACETVPLARMAKRVWTNDEDFTARIEIAHYGPKDFSRPEISWKIREATGAVIALGLLPWKAIPAGMLTPVGEMRFPLSAIKAAKKLNVEIALAGTAYANDWDFWVYPAGPAGSTNAVAPTSPTGPTGLTGPTDILISENLDEGALAKLKEGGKVLLAPPPSAIKGDKNGRIPAGFSSIFWNT
ncbi:MAG: glycoside hydrolase, partial [Candidatus Sumerlaeota bacterium]|nr:glycoside hydrolase [Candidatus Sumerlaeota bacterium]